MNNRELIFLGVCLLALFLLVWKEIIRPNKERLALRILFTATALTALLLVADPVFYSPEVSHAHEAILITEGTHADSLSGFLQKKGSGFPLLTFDETLAKAFNATYITDPLDIAARHYNAIHVFGDGIEKGQLENERLILHPAALPAGVTAVSWSTHLSPGEKLTVRGSFHNSYDKPVKLSLSVFHINSDSVMIPAHSDHIFSLTGNPKQLGRSTWLLSAVIKNDTIEKEPIPIQVWQAPPLKILMLSASPDFENKFLKNWLAEKGYEVVSRTTITKNKTAKEFINTTAINTDHLGAGLFDRFDITIADAAELASLSAGELQSLAGSISQKGKGLIIRADSILPRTLFFASLFPVTPGDTSLQHVSYIQIAGNDSALGELATPSLFNIHPQNGTQPVVINKEEKLLVNSSLYGSGKILLSVLPNTFSWMLSGKHEAYNDLWSEILNKALPAKEDEESWHIAPVFPRVNEPVTVSLQNNSSAAPVAQMENIAVYLAQHRELSFRWQGSFWPVKQGWQTGIRLNGYPYYWYVYGKDDWKNIRALNTREVTKEQSIMPVTNNSSLQVQSRQRAWLPKLFLFLLFLGSCGYLWFENKYYNS